MSLHPANQAIKFSFLPLLLSLGAACTAQVPPSLALMAANEVAAREHQGTFAYTSEERSDRTGMHLWQERDVEIGDGILRRLIAVDGRLLSKEETALEAQRLQSLVNNPDEYRRESAAHKDDEKHATSMLQLLPRAFLLTPDGTDGGCTRYRFTPDPAFKPATYEERVGSAMAGTVSLHEPENRLCILQGTLQHPVTFGFGLIGKVDAGGNFRLERAPVDGSAWKSHRISVHMGGKILLMKSLAKEQETTRTSVRSVSTTLTLAQGLQLIQP
jgi:hypothetical protein